MSARDQVVLASLRGILARAQSLGDQACAQLFTCHLAAVIHQGLIDDVDGVIDQALS